MSGLNELCQSRGVEVAFGPDLHVAHEPAGAFQQVIRVGYLGATEEPDIDVSFERVDVGEYRIPWDGKI